MLIFVIFIILLIIFFIPIPLKFTIHYSKEGYFIKFYKIDLFSKDDGLIRKLIAKKKNKKSKDKNKKKYIKFSNAKKEKKYKKHNDIKIKLILKTLLKAKFKPSIKYNSNINYSLSDAAKTAIFYGIFYNTNPILIYLFSVIFRVKAFKNNFTPVFKDEIIFELTISSIITFNLAQIIYMVFLILKCLIKNKEVALK